MSVNSSSSDYLPSNSTSHPIMSNCFRSKLSIYIFSFVSFTYILPLPLFIHVLYLGYQQWRKQGLVGMTATSHSDIFTYHSIAMQLNELFGFVTSFCGSYMGLPEMGIVGIYILAITSIAQSMFHLLICVERYLAVVHPFTYLGLRQAGGARIRNISIGCVWLLCLGSVTLTTLTSCEFNLIFYSCTISFLFVVLSFCSIWVLRALMRPMPGKVGGKRSLVDQSKRRAFHTILAMMGVLWLRFGGNLLCNLLYNSFALADVCVVLMSALWFSLPSSLMSSLLFLHRAGKLQCCKPNTESE